MNVPADGLSFTVELNHKPYLMVFDENCGYFFPSSGWLELTGHVLSALNRLAWEQFWGMNDA